jgi:hypothetical protein
MNSGNDPSDESPPRHQEQILDVRQSPSFTDEIGERVVVLDEADAPVLEVLRFRRTLTAIPGFEVALRRRIERLRHFSHPVFARTPTVEYVDQDRCLALASPYTPGRRLSSVLGHAQDPALAASLVHQLVPALEALGTYDDGVGHGALTASRIVIAREGSPIVVEYVLGPALERLHLSATEMRADLNIPVPAVNAARHSIGGTTDCFQLALVALSMLLGRPLRRDESSDRLAQVLDEALPAANGESDITPGLRSWIERALQLNGGFESIAEAARAVPGVSAPAPEIAQRWRDLLGVPEDVREEPVALDDFPEEPVEAPILVTNEVQPAENLQPATNPTALPQPVALRRSHITAKSVLQWSTAAIAALAVIEAVVIVLLLSRRTPAPQPASVAEVSLVTTTPGVPVVVDGRTAGVTPLQLTIGPEVRSIRVANPRPSSLLDAIVGSTGQARTPEEIARDAAASRAQARTAPAAALPAPRMGAIKVSSSIPLEIFDGETRLGSTAVGEVSAAPGRRELDFVNSVLGFRSRQVVDIRAGQTVPLSVSPPDGRININAVPWAEVLIDGKVVGETPIGNLSIPLGEHEIVFRHPKLGEVRRTAIVRSDAVTRVSANLER